MTAKPQNPSPEAVTAPPSVPDAGAAVSTTPANQNATTTQGSAPGSDLAHSSDLYAEIHQLSQPEVKPAPKKEPLPASAPDVSKGTAAAVEADKSSVQTPEKPAEPRTVPELRKAYAAMVKRHADLEKQFNELKAKPVPEDPEKKTLVERLEAREKRLQEIEQELRFSAYERSDEYKDKYQKPFEDTYQTGRAKTAALKIVEIRNPDTDEIVQAARQASAEDFDNIMRIADDGDALDYAERLFGKRASLVMIQRERVQEMHRARLQAIQDYAKQGNERERLRTEKQSKQAAELTAAFRKENEAAAEKYPQWFKPEEGDDKGNELLEKGFRLADAAFTGNGVPPETLVKVHSALRNKAAGFDRLVFRLSQAKTRIAELEKELQAFKASEPTAGETRREANKLPRNLEEEIAAIH